MRSATCSKRVFLLGPSHHHYLATCALTRCDYYETPLGNLRIDKDTVAELHASGEFDKMSQRVDENEHSLEMHLPYIYKILSRYKAKVTYALS
jgi:MEMO1 family protein